MESALLQVNAGHENLEGVRSFAFDLDGTIYLQGRPLPGALELLAALRKAEIPYLFVTNNSSASSDAYLEKLGDLGLSPDRSQTLTSNDVAISHLLASGFRRPYLLATDAVRAEYAGHGLVHEEDTPDAVLLAFDTTLDFRKISRVSSLVDSGLPYLATHPDVTCPVPGGFLPDTGSFIELFAAVTGRRPEVLGKPHNGMIAEISRRLELPAPEIAFVGDRLQTDIRMAADAGFVSVLTMTGVTDSSDLQSSDLQPDVVIDGMRNLHELLRGRIPAP